MDKKSNKKIIQINSVCRGSTGNIVKEIQKEAIKNGYDVTTFFGRGSGFDNRLKSERFGNCISFVIHVLLAVFLGKNGHGSYNSTKKMIARIREINPDIIHLHNIHGYYLNIPMLMNYLKEEYNGKIYWTFHDCWPFTGHCPHFILAECNKWVTGCCKCPNRFTYPFSILVDRSSKNYKEKKNLFNSIKINYIITPSIWLKNRVEKSFLSNINITTIHNYVDKDEYKFNIRQEVYDKYCIPKDKKIILGVANVWEKRKGLMEFIELSKKITDEYVIVLVGLNKRQIQHVKKYNIVGIERTSNKSDLCSIYSLSTVFVNPSKEETFSLVTAEALLCGTPCLVYDNTPMKEFVDESNGAVCDNRISFDDIKRVEKLKKHKSILNIDLSIRNTIYKYINLYND